MSNRIVWFKNNIAIGVYDTIGDASRASGFSVNAINSSLMGSVQLPRAQRFIYEVTMKDIREKKKKEN